MAMQKRCWRAELHAKLRFPALCREMTLHAADLCMTKAGQSHGESMAKAAFVSSPDQ
ncbi:MAG: hypothetical protein ACRYGK_03950 [Janthinobacterium lividum]